MSIEALEFRKGLSVSTENQAEIIKINEGAFVTLPPGDFDFTPLVYPLFKYKVDLIVHLNGTGTLRHIPHKEHPDLRGELIVLSEEGQKTQITSKNPEGQDVLYSVIRFKSYPTDFTKNTD